MSALRDYYPGLSEETAKYRIGLLHLVEPAVEFYTALKKGEIPPEETQPLFTKECE